ncbi:hypothetical protein CC78DRAFT_566296 [Lojkania enalia]|uniref:Uncharacterized protein n=1 Tax=Lojkania enalia TaxID=147567 RepID=A0A9P4N8Z4_9PLEO|nr:hypothetical protein CC78DRAFT_566296 [Didymosphaeria enalia]
MSSITTAIPTGALTEWCLHTTFDWGDGIEECANSTRGTSKEDFQTFCCDGDVIDKTQNIWFNRTHDVTLENLACCRYLEPQMGGLRPIPDTNYMTCTEGIETPLASLAATNTDNAVEYTVVYKSAKEVGTSLTDMIWTTEPYCFWAYTKNASMVEITLPAAQITPPPPPTTDMFGQPISTATTTATEDTSSDDVSPEKTATIRQSGTSQLLSITANPPDTVGAAALSPTSSITTSAAVDEALLLSPMGESQGLELADAFRKRRKDRLGRYVERLEGQQLSWMPA